MGSGWTVFSAIFLTVLLLAGGGYFVLQVYTPPVSATAPVTPEVRQFGLYLHAFEAQEGKVHHWVPAVIVVNAGDTVVLRVTNTDDENTHGFSLGALNVTVPAIPAGQSVTVRFTATRPGIYSFECMLAECSKDHMEQTGQLVVLSGR